MSIRPLTAWLAGTGKSGKDFNYRFPTRWRISPCRWWWALLTLTFLSACSEPLTPLRPLGESDVILAFGDSLTRGTGAAPEESYPAVLSTLIDREVINAGIPGELSASGLERLPAVLEREQPSLVILCHGGNDILRKRNLSRARDNLVQMVKLARAAGADVLLVAAPTPGVFLEAAAFYQDAAELTGAALESDAVAEILAQPELKSDTVHPNARGYRRLAELIAEQLRLRGAL